MSIVQHIVAFCCRHAVAVIAFCAVLSAGTGVYVANNFAMNTDSSQLITAEVGWRMKQAQFDASFPGQTNLVLVVIDGKTPELAESAAARLSARLAQRPELFATVRRPDGQPLTNAQPGDPLEVDGEQVTIDTVEFSQPARW